MRRRRFLQAVCSVMGGPAVGFGTAVTPNHRRPHNPGVAASPSKFEKPSSASRALQNAISFGDLFVIWQSPFGGPDPVKCPYRTPGLSGATQLHSVAPLTRALYKLYDVTHLETYKESADRYATFYMSTLRDPYKPYFDEINLAGSWGSRLSRTWLYGKGLSPCYEHFRLHNPNEDAFDLKAYALYRWMQAFRMDPGYFSLGYNGTHAQGSCDLGEAGRGLVGFYSVSKYPPVLKDAIGLAKWFLTDWHEGSRSGIWSSEIGTWLLVPQGGAGRGEHMTGQIGNKNGWGWSSYIDGDYLLRLYPLVEDESIRVAIADKCVKAFQWCFDSCQFEDGSHGMLGRDDKWVGMGAAALLLYFELKKAGVLPRGVEETYLPRVKKSWQWMLEHTSPDTYPPDGYIRVHGTTTKRPPENLVWLMAWTTIALIEGPKFFPSD
jgi:hypothetical protein